MDEFKEMCATVHEGVARVRALTKRHALASYGSLGATVRIDPPASEAHIRSVEEGLERALPTSMRRVFAECFSHLEIAWYFPGDEPWLSKTVNAATLIEAFADVGNPSDASEYVNSANFKIGLGEVRWLTEEADYAAGQLRDAQEHQDADGARSFAARESVFQSCIAFGVDVMGDSYCVDTATEDETVIHIDHTGEEIGFALDLSMLAFVAEKAKLEFVGSDYPGLLAFDVKDDARALADRYSGMEGMVTPITFRADGKHGRGVRRWLDTF